MKSGLNVSSRDALWASQELVLGYKANEGVAAGCAVRHGGEACQETYEGYSKVLYVVQL